MIRMIAVAVTVLSFFAPPAVLAQQAPPVASARLDAPVSLTANQRVAAIEAIVAAIREKYVFPERVPAIEAKLRESHAAGRYAVDAPRAFAERVTEDLRQSSDDGHMYLDYAPERYTLASSASSDAEREAATMTYWHRQARRDNHGLAEMRILAGNVRYLKITGFHWIDDETGAAYDAAARFLRGGDAIILDLRGNGGGSHGAVRYLISHFLEPNRHEMTFLQAGEPPSQSRTLDYLPSGRLTDQPLYVLTNGRTASAAEAFAYDVQQFRLGRLIGEKTAGGANNNSFVPVAPGFMLSVSYGRPVHPVSGSNWEGTGITPDIAVSSAQALKAAHAEMLTELLGRSDADPVARADWEWARTAAQARLAPVSVPESQLQALAGSYGSDRVVFREGSLWFKRADRQPQRLLPLDNRGLFEVEGYREALRLRLDGRDMEILWIDEPEPIRVSRSDD